MARENSQYLKIINNIFKNTKLPRGGQGTKGRDGTRQATRQRGLKSRNSNCAGRQVTREYDGDEIPLY